MENRDLTEILKMIFRKITKELTDAYYNNNLEEILKKYGFDDEEDFFSYTSNSKILVIGELAVGEDILRGIAKSRGLLPNMLEFVSDYAKLTNYNFSNLRCNMTYSDILVGPIPHSVKGIDGYSSFLAMVKASPSDFPKVIELRDNNGLKITKSSFKEGIEKTRLFSEL